MRFYFDKAMGLFEILLSREGRRAFAGSRPFSIASYQLLNSLRRGGLDIGTVIDAGANVGQFARAAAGLYPNVRIYSIEALPAAAQRLRNNLSDLPDVEVIETAIGSSDGRIAFFPNAYSLASSALPLRGDRTPSFGELEHLEPIDVPLARLDTIFRDRELVGPTLLKLDLQGFELEALRGARETLGRCDHVLVEVSFDADYEGAPSFDEILGLLRDHAFAFSRPLSFLMGKGGRVQEMDALFSRPSVVTRVASPLDHEHLRGPLLDAVGSRAGSFGSRNGES